MPWSGYSELTCQDVLFSGHTVGLTLASLVLIRFTAWSPWTICITENSVFSFATLFKLVVIFNMLFGYYVIIASKFHYTTDVLIAFMLTILIFEGYHSRMRVAFLPRYEQSTLPRHTIYRWIRWFEDDAADAKVLSKLMRGDQAQLMPP